KRGTMANGNGSRVMVAASKASRSMGRADMRIKYYLSTQNAKWAWQLGSGFLPPRGKAAGGGRCALAGLPAWRPDGGIKKGGFTPSLSSALPLPRSADACCRSARSVMDDLGGVADGAGGEAGRTADVRNIGVNRRGFHRIVYLPRGDGHVDRVGIGF